MRYTADYHDMAGVRADDLAALSVAAKMLAAVHKDKGVAAHLIIISMISERMARNHMIIGFDTPLDMDG